jgi:imidazolonepropionase-like amidohydrolase
VKPMRLATATVAAASVALVAALWPVSAAPQRTAIRAARLVPIVGEERAPAFVTIENGKIVAIGGDAPPGVPVVDFPDGTLFPGLVDAHSHLGSPFDVDDDVDAFDDRMRAIDAFDPTSEAVRRAPLDGVTTIVFAPGEGNVVAGVAATVKTGGAREPLRAESGLQLTIGSDATRPLRAPTSRMGLLAMLRERLRATGGDPKAPLARMLRGEIPALVHARTAAEILAARDLAREFGLKPIFLHVDEGWRVASELRGGGPVACGPLTADTPERVLRNPGRLEAAGVHVAFMSEAPVMPPSSLRSTAAFAVRYGMSRDAALRAITLEAARVAGVADRVGSIEVGKDADLVVFSGDPLDLSSRVIATYVDGVSVTPSPRAAGANLAEAGR